MRTYHARAKAQSAEGSGLKGVGSKRYTLATELDGRSATDVAEVGLCLLYTSDAADE